MNQQPPAAGRMPRQIPYIIANEGCERFSFYGMRNILTVFLMTSLLLSIPEAMRKNEAKEVFHTFVIGVYFFPLLGGWIADRWFGKYHTILWLSLVYCAGHACLALFDTNVHGFYFGLFLIAIGSGGIKPCVSSHVGDQFGSDNQHLLGKAFGWFYFSINFGSFFSILLVPWLLEHYGPGAAFGVPAVLMLAAAFVFWLGRYKFAHIPPGGKKFIEENFNPEGLRTLGRIALIFVFVSVFWSLWDQSGGEWVLQAEKMNLDFLGIKWLSSQIQAVNAIMILAFIPLFQYVVYPLIDRVYKLTLLRKIGLGLIVTGLSFLISAWIETQIAAGLKPSIGWQMPAYALLSAG